MNETLILLLGATPEAPCHWAFMAEGRVALADKADGVGALSEIADRAERARFVAAVLQGESVAMRSLPAPPKTQSQFRAAAGFLLEDELAENLDQVHVAAVRHDSGAGMVLAVKRAVMETWLQAFADAGLSPDLLTADYALLPMAEHRAVFLTDHNRIIGAAGLNGFALDRPLADEIAVSLSGAESLTDVQIYGDDLESLDAEEAVVVERHAALNGESIFVFMAESLGSAPNLLQGTYRKRRDWRMTAGPWRRAAMLAAASLGAFFLSTVATSVRDLRTADQLNAETLALHQAAFPDAATSDPRTHARQVLAAGGGQPAFLHLTGAIADSVNSRDGVQIDRIRYNAARDEYSVNLRFSDIAQFEALKQRLESQGVRTAETGGVRRTGTVYLGELRVSLS